MTVLLFFHSAEFIMKAFQSIPKQIRVIRGKPCVKTLSGCSLTCQGLHINPGGVNLRVTGQPIHGLYKRGVTLAEVRDGQVHRRAMCLTGVSICTNGCLCGNVQKPQYTLIVARVWLSLGWILRPVHTRYRSKEQSEVMVYLPLALAAAMYLSDVIAGCVQACSNYRYCVCCKKQINGRPHQTHLH